MLVQDYHFALLPRMIKEKRPDARVAIFWHIPWPNPEAFGICPWQRELLDGLLGADLIGFHIQAHCNNFLQTVDRAVESRIDWEHFAVQRHEHLTLVRPFPYQRGRSADVRNPPRRRRPTSNARALLKASASRRPIHGRGRGPAWTTPREFSSASSPSSVFWKSIRATRAVSHLCRSARPAARTSSAITICWRKWKRRPTASIGGSRRIRWKPIVLSEPAAQPRGN